MATATTLNVMTLGPQQKAMTSLIQPAPSGTNCVILTTQQQASPHQTASKTLLIQQKRPIAPADARSSVVINGMSSSSSTSTSTSTTAADMLRCKRRINFSHNTHLTYSGLPGHQPASVARRNARERNRVKQVNNGFATLRSHIPLSVAAALASPTPASNSSSSNNGRGASKKLSKVETLRMAVEYIRSLQQMLDDHAAETSSTTSSAPESSAALGVATSDNGYYSSSPESSVTLLATTLPASHYSHHALGPQPTSLSPPCSEASSSPTPSYASEGSASGSAVSYAPASVYQQDNYENYEPMSPEDEELLDVISWWQQSQ